MSFDLENAGEELLFAAAEGDEQEVRALLQDVPGAQQREALLNFRDGDHWNSLHIAANNGHAEVLQVVLDAVLPTSKCVTAKTRQGDTPLHFACGVGHGKIVSMLLHIPGFDVRSVAAVENKRNETPLHCAAHGGSDEVIGILISKSRRQLTSHAENGGTPLHYASAEGNPSAVHTLLGMRADTNAVDYKGRTFYDVAHPDVRATLESLARDENPRGSIGKLPKMLELANERMVADDFKGAKFGFGAILRICNGSDQPSDEPDGDDSVDPWENSAMDVYAEFEFEPQSEHAEAICVSFVGLARCHLQLNELHPCVAASSAALRMNPGSVEALQYRGLASLALEEIEQAEQDLRNAVSLAPHDASVRRAMAQAMPRLKQLKSREVDVARRMLELSDDMDDDRRKRLPSRPAGNSTVAADPIQWEVMD